ncbi:MAG: 30S ribosomal protein S18 [Planctomycetes bacterium]|nr:30S ribosomal protein S18 [Planctomycetota bacterium]
MTAEESNDARRRHSRCRDCRSGARYIDYKDFKTLQKFTTMQGKIHSRKRTGKCAYHQRKLVQAIKRARFLALLPFVSKG